MKNARGKMAVAITLLSPGILGSVALACSMSERSKHDSSATVAEVAELDADRARLSAQRSRARIPARALSFAVDARGRVGVHPPIADASLKVTLPLRADGKTRVEDSKSKVAVSIRSVGAISAKAATLDGLIVYRNAVMDGDVLQTVNEDRTEDFVAFERRPPREHLAYAIDLENVAGLRLVGNVLELLDAGGAPRLRVPEPSIVDSSGEAAPKHGALTIEGCAFDTSPAAPWSRPVTAPGSNTCTLHVSWFNVVYPAIVDPGWVATIGMVHARGEPQTIMLPTTGKVLVFGGYGEALQTGIGLTSTAQAELFDPATRTFAVTATGGDSGRRPIKLLSNKILIPMGLGGASQLYDPALGVFINTGEAKTGGSAVAVLPNGKVFIVEGPAAELYDPASGVFTLTQPMKTQEGNATHLGGSKILLSGGRPEPAAAATANADIFDAEQNTITPVGPMSAPRRLHAGTRLPDGRVLLAGGVGSGGFAIALTELFDPATNTFAALPLTSFMGGKTLVTLASGRAFLCCGGKDAPSSSTFFDPATNTFELGPSLIGRRDFFASVALDNGQVLLAGSGTYQASIDSMVGSRIATVLDLSTNGKTCTDAKECASGFCIEGVCCNAACGGACDSCKIVGSEGTCSPMAKGQPGEPLCEPLLCDGTNAACPSACAVDADCSPGTLCSAENKCVSIGACDGNHTITELDGTTKDCAPYKCSRGTCNTQCKSVADCVAPNACDANGACVPPSAASDGEEGGCRVGGGGASTETGTLFGVAIVSLLHGVFRRRRKASR